MPGLAKRPDPARAGRATPPGAAGARRLTANRVVPPAVEQLSVSEILIEVERELGEGAAAEMYERAVPFVTVRRHAPARGTDAERQVGFVPSGRHERLVQRA